jgi:RNAse (barnase) inhibitor barstar
MRIEFEINDNVTKERVATLKKSVDWSIHSLEKNAVLEAPLEDYLKSKCDAIWYISLFGDVHTCVEINFKSFKEKTPKELFKRIVNKNLFNWQVSLRFNDGDEYWSYTIITDGITNIEDAERLFESIK